MPSKSTTASGSYTSRAGGEGTSEFPSVMLRNTPAPSNWADSSSGTISVWKAVLFIWKEYQKLIFVLCRALDLVERRKDERAPWPDVTSRLWVGGLGRLMSFSSRQDLRLAALHLGNRGQQPILQGLQCLQLSHILPTLVATWGVLVPSLPIHWFAPVPINVTEGLFS